MTEGDDDPGICGYEGTDRGYPCQNPATDGDSCWLEGHGGDVDHPGGGRPEGSTKLAKMAEAEAYELMDSIAEVIENGGSIAEAARKSGIHRETIGSWMEIGEGKPEGEIHREFFDRLVRARGEGEGNYRQMLMRIALESEDTASLMAMLKQRYPESWGEVNRGEQAGGVVVNLGEEEEFEVDPETLEVVDGLEDEGE